MPARILVVDDEPSMQMALREFLAKRGYETDVAGSAEAGLEKIRQKVYDLILLDIRLPGMSGIEAIPHIRECESQGEIIVITAHGSSETALQAVERGAYDFFSKPFSLKEMEIVVRRALEKRRLQEEIKALRKQIPAADPAERIIGGSECMKQVKALVRRIAPLETTVLITGESGTGKELVAEVLHLLSRRAGGPFVMLNCAAIPDTLLESELFGFERGAFTGAVSAKPGKFELANSGTIFLDEIGDMPANLQAKLLRTLERREVDRLGGRMPIPVNVRIIAATNQDLPELITKKAFREDLYYRLNVASIHVPPLRDRPEDLPLLAAHFLRGLNIRLGIHLTGISKDAMEVLLNRDWPGNVRELLNILERAAIVSAGGILTADAVKIASRRFLNALADEEDETECISLMETLYELEKRLIVSALEKSGGVQAKAAKILGLSPKNLWKKMRKHSLND